ncbi:MAG: TonB-dependent receptor [Filimonas sp.]|nr:TonB-dependent receptor [Filimonas sp.]
MRMKNMLFWSLVLSALCMPFLLQAQVTTADIVGLVADAQKPIAGATITAIHTPTGTKYVTTSRKDGHFTLPNLRVGGPYTITTSYVGFKEEKQENVFLTLGQEFKVDFSLQSDSKTLTEVTVKSARQDKIFNNSRTGSQEVISRSQLERLPTVNRSLLDFTRLTPASSGWNIGGRNGFMNNVTVDGANFNNTFGLGSSPSLGSQTSSQPISLDAIEQIQVNTSPYDVTQGGFTGAGINSVTRSGTNEFKGSVYTYLKGPGTQGYNVRTATVPKQDFSYNLRGASVGGPIIKNKLFFFVSGEQERLTQPGTSFVASDASHLPGNNVSQAKASDLDQLRTFLMSNYSYDPGEYQGYSYKTSSDKLTVKIDLNLGSAHTLTLKYNYLKSFRDQPASNSGSVNSVNGRAPGTTAMPFYGSGYTINNNFNIFIAELNSRFGNNASNKFQIGYSALRDFRTALSAKDFPLVDILDGSGNPFTSFGYEQYTYGNKLNSNIFQFSDIFKFYRGTHDITIGTQNFYKKYSNGFSPSYEGVYRFNSLADFYKGAAAGSTFAAARYDLSYSLMSDGSFPLATPAAWELGFFAQDKWKVKRNFILTYGIRVDVPIITGNFDTNPVVQTLTFRDGQKIDVGAKPAVHPLFSPRVGFNWDVFNNQQTQLRGGVGLFAGPPPFVWISNQASNNGVQFGSIANGNSYVFSPNINAYRPATVTANKSYSLAAIDHDFKYPQILKATLAIDQKLPGDFIVTLEGNVSKDINAVNFENVNLPTTGTVLQGSDGRTRYSATQIYPVGGSGASTVNNPIIGNAILMKNYSKGYAYYATLQVQKNFKNLYASVAYTYMNSKDLAVGGSTPGTMWGSRQVSGDPNAPELGYSNFFVPHRVIAAASYKIEYGKNYATSIGLVFEAAPAGVASYVYNGDLNNDGNTGNDLIYVPSGKSDIVLVPVNTGGGVITDTRTPDQIWAQLNNYISQDAYLSKHRGEVVKRNGLVLPFFKRLDLNITQDFYFKTKTSKHTLRLTFDMVNVGNFLNKNWGVYKTTNSLNILKYEGLTADNHPRFSFPYLDPSNQIPLVNSFKDDLSTLSRWQAQIGIRYLFN